MCSCCDHDDDDDDDDDDYDNDDDDGDGDDDDDDYDDDDVSDDDYDDDDDDNGDDDDDDDQCDDDGLWDPLKLSYNNRICLKSGIMVRNVGGYFVRDVDQRFSPTLRYSAVLSCPLIRDLVRGFLGFYLTLQ